MPLSDDADPDILINRLAGGLAPVDRAAFRSAVEAAIEQLPCAGPGVAYRTVAALWRSYFHPPSDREVGEAVGSGSRRRPSKLANGPPIGADDPRTGGRDRHRLKLVG
jgi:hypothetical protein